MKVKQGTTPLGGTPAAAPTQAQSAAKAVQAKAKAAAQAPDLAAQARSQAALGGPAKGSKSPVAQQNAAGFPGAKPAFRGTEPGAKAEARAALALTLDATKLSAERKAKAEKSVPASPRQLLLTQVRSLVPIHAPIAWGEDPNLATKSETEVARRQAFSGALLEDLAARLLATVPLEEAIRSLPNETAALLANTDPATQAKIDGLVEIAQQARQLRGYLRMVGDAAERGLPLSAAEQKLLIGADRLADEDPQAAFASIQQIAERAHAHLQNPKPATPSLDDLAALRAQIAAQKAAPSPAQKLAKAQARVVELQAEVAGAKTPDVADRFRGAMLGLAIGDALGGPTEFMSREDIRDRYGLVTDMIGGGWLNLAPGEYTDDTQMAVAMGESILAKGDLDAGDLADRFVTWLNTDPKDVGNLTRSALELRRAGVEPGEAGRIPWMLGGFENAGNGSVMRAAPVALLTAFQSPEVIAEKASASSAMTHFDPRCTWGTAAMGYATSLIMKGEADVLGKTVAWLEDKSPELAEALAQVPHLDLEEVRTSGFVVHTVQAAFWALHHATDYVDGIVKISNLGEDTDTAGATAGILLGARFGVDGIPPTWRKQLQNVDGLTKMADGLRALATGEAAPAKGPSRVMTSADPAKLVKLLSEEIEGAYAFAGDLKKAITFFGGARIDPKDAFFQEGKVWGEAVLLANVAAIDPSKVQKAAASGLFSAEAVQAATGAALGVGVGQYGAKAVGQALAAVGGASGPDAMAAALAHLASTDTKPADVAALQALTRTGAGPGMMEAVPMGYVDARQKITTLFPELLEKLDQLETQGSRIRLPFEQETSPYIEKLQEFEHFLPRRLALTLSTVGFDTFPGGFGTLNEAFEVIHLGMPATFHSKTFWSGMLGKLSERWEARGLVDKSVLDNLKVVDGAAEGLPHILERVGQHAPPSVDPAEAKKMVADIQTGLPAIAAREPAVSIIGGFRLDPDASEVKAARGLAAQLTGAGVPMRLGSDGPLYDAVVAGMKSADPDAKLDVVLQRYAGKDPSYKVGPEAEVVAAVDTDAAHKLLGYEQTDALVALPGGVGTFDRVFELATLIQCGKTPARPMVLVGKEFWQPLLDEIRKAMLEGPRKTIGDDDLELFTVVDTAEEAFSVIQGFRAAQETAKS